MSRTLKTLTAAAMLSFGLASTASAQFQPPNQFGAGAIEAAMNGPRTITVTCQGSARAPGDENVLCLNFGQFQLRSDGPGAMVGVRITAPTTHCASINYVIQRVSNERNEMSGWLAPGRTTTVALANDLPAGTHSFRVWGWGRVGDGCMSEQMHSFAATIEPVIIP